MTFVVVTLGAVVVTLPSLLAAVGVAVVLVLVVVALVVLAMVAMVTLVREGKLLNFRFFFLSQNNS